MMAARDALGLSTEIIGVVSGAAPATAKSFAAKKLVTHPATTTHGRLSPEARAAAGITEGLVRLAVGLEAVADLQADLEQGLR